MSERRLRITIAVLAFTGAGIASYLTIARLTHTPVVCVTGGCETVQTSRYSELFGLPVAAIGLVGYVLLASSAALRTNAARTTGAVTAIAGLIFAAYLVYIQVGVLGAVCQWCLASDLMLALLVPATLLRLRRG